MFSAVLIGSRGAALAADSVVLILTLIEAYRAYRIGHSKSSTLLNLIVQEGAGISLVSWFATDDRSGYRCLILQV